MKAIQIRISDLKENINAPYNRKRIMKRAWYIFKNTNWHCLTFSEVLKSVWKEERQYKASKKVKLKGEVMQLLSMYDVRPTPDFELNRSYNNGVNI